MTEFTLPAAAARPRRLEVGADGMVWYTDYPRGYLGRLNPATREVREWRSPSGTGSAPYGITIAKDGRVWYNESTANQMIGFDPQSEQFEIVRIPTAGSIVRNVASDAANQRIWLALSGTQRIGKLDIARP
jgi:virginiamycin B lyase